MRPRVLAVVLLATCAALSAPRACAAPGADAAAMAAAPTLRATTGPARVFAEPVGDRQDLNFEVFVANPGTRALRLASVEATARDAAGRVLWRRSLDGNGVRPAIDAVPTRELPAGGTLTVFNPLPSLPRGLAVATFALRLGFEAVDAKDGEPALEANAVVHPVAWRGTALRFPLRGRTWNYDGHDLLAHHRRFDYTFAPIAAFGFRSNFMRYAADFVPVDARGEAHAPGRDENAAWHGFGAEVLAVADGVVVASEGTRADDRRFDQDKLAAEPMRLFGNYVVIDHGGGAFSVSGHLQRGSVVAPGTRVRAGTRIGRIGASGSAFFPHLHFELQDGPTLAAEGLPATFDGLRDQAGVALPPRTVVDTGAVVEAR